ncbi:calcium-transporting ATPase [Pseudohyphozyma bogoriensis]|nr:calcium-transporting ATPase [Pseudohyphozyma bogoriensis]
MPSDVRPEKGASTPLPFRLSTQLDAVSPSPSRTSSPALPPDDHYAYSTSLRRHEPDTAITLGATQQSAAPGRYSHLAGPSSSSPAAHILPSFASPQTSNYPPPPPQASHHPFAHTTSPITPSAHHATLSVAQTLSALGTSSSSGLASAKVPAIRELSGPNEFEVEAKDPLWKKFVGQFYESPLNLLLLASAAVSAVVGNYDDASSILAAIFIVITVGFVQEQRSEKSLEALNKLVPHYCHLIRDGNKTTQLANVLVPGDLITFGTGDRIPADLRLTAAHQLEIDESALTGETHPARKHVDAIATAGLGVGGLPIAERRNIAFMGTLVRSGRGEGIVVGTGVQSEFGVVFSMMQEIGDRKTPLQLSMDELANKLSAISFGVIGIICLIGVFQHRGWLEMFTIGVSLAVAAIPEGLPIVVTVTLALGVLRMSKRKAIVKKLPSVETLGSVSVICSDKTGTLTTNVMTVTKAFTVDHGVFDVDSNTSVISPDDPRAKVFLAGNICNGSFKDRSGKYVGQATEVALMNVLPMVGLRDSREGFARKLEVPFTSETKYQSVTGSYTASGADATYLTGAIEIILPMCRFYLRSDASSAPLDPNVTKIVLAKAMELASNGLRIVGMAYGPDPNSLVFAGFQGMMDPPRKGVDQAIAQLHAGGIQVVMITGDSEQTALSIAKQLGIRVNPGSSGCLTGKDIDLLSQRQLTDRIAGVSVFARTTPRHKMAIIEAFQTRGAVVAMTGDGVNDAPALKMADIGVAMGKGGTDVAKEAADVILVDDNFSTLLPAVEEGKSIFLNIQNFLVFQLSTAVAALSLITLSTALGLPNPLNAMQILYINILMDGPPAQSLGVDPVNRDIMRRPPRPKNAPILSQRLLARVGFSAAIIICGVLFVLGRELSDGTMAQRDQTMTFTSFVFLDLASALQNRGLNVPLFSGKINKMLVLTVGVSFFAQLSLIYVPFLQSVFQTQALSLRDLTVLLTLGGCSMSLHELRRRWERKEAIEELWSQAQTAPTAILFHGFPDLPYGWRYQIRDLQARGYRVLAPYMLGYGGTSKPTNIEAYSMKSMSYDLASLLDQVGVKGKVFVLGHDWGGQMAWRFVNYFPERVHCVAVVCTPYSKPSTPSTPLMTDDFLEKHVPNFGYQLYFKTPEAIDEISEVVDLFLQPMHSPNLRRQQAVPEEGKMGNWVKKGRLQASIQRQIAARRAGKLPPPLPEAELDHYIDTFNKGGMAGPLAWYKTRAVNHHEEVAHNHDPFPPHIPALLLSATLDAALPPSMATSKSVLGAFPAGNLEDVEPDEELDAELALSTSSLRLATPPPEEASTSAIPHAEVPLSELLDTLPPLISYTPLSVPLTTSDAPRQVTILRRDLFDARFQVIAQDSEADELGEGEAGKGKEKEQFVDEDSDLVKNVYEGGLKTWECSLDLVDCLDGLGYGQTGETELVRGKSVLELGCGTALPSCSVFSRLIGEILRAPTEEGAPTPKKTRVYLQDYNKQVLSLITLPNILLAYAQHLASSPETGFDLPPGDVEVNPEFLDSFESMLKRENIELKFFEGDWSGMKVDVDDRFDLVLTSETIYSIPSLPPLLNLLNSACIPETTTCLVACKRIYFGVGGGEHEFRRRAEEMGAGIETAWGEGVGEGRDTGVGRVVMSVKWP